jgi:late competence protein required for DNA uptake (superfamily II DNA/RNA helicase)
MHRGRLDLQELLHDFHVQSEDELYKKLVVEPMTIPCMICGREKTIDELCFIDSDPYCKDCLELK